MSGDNLFANQDFIRYNVEVLHHEEWIQMDWADEIEKFPKEYREMKGKSLSKQEVEILEGRDLTAYEGMVYGKMYADWKSLKGYD